jgi:hypothetical protein
MQIKYRLTAWSLLTLWAIAMSPVSAFAGGDGACAVPGGPAPSEFFKQQATEIHAVSTVVGTQVASARGRRKGAKAVEGPAANVDTGSSQLTSVDHNGPNTFLPVDPSVKPHPASEASRARVVKQDHVIDVDGDRIAVSGGVLEAKPFRYVPADNPKAVKTMAEAVIKKELKVSLGKKLDEGGMRQVFELNDIPGMEGEFVAKVYDLTLQEGVDAEMIALLIQRELAIEDLLIANGVNVARIVRNEALLKRGIIIQRRIRGTELGKYRPGLNDVKALAKIDKFNAKIARLDKDVQELTRNRYGLVLKQSHIRHLNETEVQGVDKGNQHSNILVGPDGEPILIDW